MKIITISREFGSGGRELGKRLAEELGIHCYDHEIIELIAKEHGFDERYVANISEKCIEAAYPMTIGHRFAMPPVQIMDQGFQVAAAQQQIIENFAKQGDCVIVGRCGEDVLRARKDVLRVFVYAPKEWRLAYGKENNMLQAKDEKGIKDEIDKTDRNRAAYYNYYTQNRWGDAHNYDLAINAALGRETCVKMILDAAAAKEKTLG